MTQADLWTIGRLLTWTTDYLKKHGADSPRLDAEVLLAEARSCRRIELYTAFDEVAPDETRTAFRELVRRRAEGTPVAYLVGRREFYSLEFHVTHDVLIPRPETEFVMVRLLDLVRQSGKQPVDIVDVGTGSGILAVCAAHHMPSAKVVALDVSVPALQIAKRNAESHGVADRIKFLESDLLGSLPAEQQFDFVVSNPPYVSQGEWAQLSREIREQEPKQALIGGETGTEVIARLIPQAAEHLRPGGWMLVEISPMIENTVRGLLQQDGRFTGASTVKDLAKLPRVIEAQRTD